MDKEYSINISLEPHPWDNEKEPYFWCIFRYYGNEQCNTGCGWSKAPEQAFLDAMDYHKKYHINK